MTNTILLLILDGFVAFYFAKALWPESKRTYFKRKIRAVTREIWETEFKIEKSLQIREGIRQDRDHLLDAKNKVEVALKGNPKDEKLLKEFEQIVDTIKRYELQMKMIDDQIAGGVMTEDNPAGQGLNEIVASQAEVKKMYKDYLRKI